MAESGRDDTPIFAPVEPGTWNAESKREEILARWDKPLSGTGWEQVWAFFTEREIVAHLDLRSQTLATTRHRALLGMGVERPYRGRGLSVALIEAAVAWGRENGLAWIDPCVFAHNLPAFLLYKKMGFVETGRVKDAFRVQGRPMEDVSMTLHLNP